MNYLRQNNLAVVFGKRIGVVLQNNILLELAKLPEMSEDVLQKLEHERQYREALAQTTKLSKTASEKRQKVESVRPVPRRLSPR